MQVFSCLGEAERFGDGDEVAEVTKFHAGRENVTQPAPPVNPKNSGDYPLTGRPQGKPHAY